MTLAELIDLEAQLAHDRAVDSAALEIRDRALLGAAGSGQAASRAPDDLLRHWLLALHEADRAQPRPGRTVAGALRGLRRILVAAGLALGWAAATALLRYGGDAPVNVWDFLLAFVAIQLLLLALLLGTFLLPVASLGLPRFGMLRGLLAALYPRLAARVLRGHEERLAEWQAFWHRLRSRRSLYHHVEPWVLLALTQSFGVAFNVGALLGCLRLVVFSDLAFGWSTTLVQLDAGRFHAVVQALAAPFAWLWPDAGPSRELVEATRYSRFDAAYVGSGAQRSAHPDLVGGWWPFLLASLAFYGLLPRVATLSVASARARWLLARLSLDDAEVTRVVRRLSEPHVETRSPDPEAPGAVRARPAAVRVGGSHPTRCALVLWRDVPASAGLERAVARHVGCAVAGARTAGGRDYEEGGTDWRRLLDGADPVVVVAEAWEAPDKAALRLLRELRGAAGPRRQLVVLLVQGGREPSPGQVRIWQEGVATLEDPYLAVEPLREAP